MKNIILWFLLLLSSCGASFAQAPADFKPILKHSRIRKAEIKRYSLTQFPGTIARPDVCHDCVMDTTGGYISIVDTIKINPICNFELLTAANLALTHQIKLNRDSIPFFPSGINQLYKKSGDSRGHVIPFEDLAYSFITGKASMNLTRNLAPQPQDENVGTKLACEDLSRKLANQYLQVKVYGGTYGTLGDIKGINKPAVYWTLIVTPEGEFVYWMPTTGADVSQAALKDCPITVQALIVKLGFDPKTAINK